MDFKNADYAYFQLSAYPGEQFQLGVQAFDELDRPTATILRLSETDVSVVWQRANTVPSSAQLHAHK